MLPGVHLRGAAGVAREPLPEDRHVIATGQRHSVRDPAGEARKEIGIQFRWEGAGIQQKGYWTSPSPHGGEGRGEGGKEQLIVAVDPR